MVTKSEFTIWGRTWLIEADWSVASSPILVNGEVFKIVDHVGCPPRYPTVGDYKHNQKPFRGDFLREVIDIDPDYGGSVCCPNCECDEPATDEDDEEIKSEWECGGDDWGNGCMDGCAYKWRDLPSESESLEAAGQQRLFVDPGA